jgi:predicted Fe-Mo cluster-binding NifX family protein
MRIAVSAEDRRGLDALVSAHFGRCPFFVFVEIEDGAISRVEVAENPFYGRHEPGQVPAFIRARGADVMLTGGMGARAVAFFEACGVEPVTGAQGTVRQAVEDYLSGRLRGAGACGESAEHLR